MAANHHYVPQFLLRNFRSDPKARLWVYDKKTGKSFAATEENVAAERNFYEAKVLGGTLSLEEGLSELETKASTVVERIVSRRHIGGLDDTDRAVLAVFAAVQMVRVPHSRERGLAMVDAVRGTLQERLDGPVDDLLPAMSSEDAKILSLLSFHMGAEFAEHFLNKSWLLFETTASTPLYISDNPVVLQNLNRAGVLGGGNLGLAVRGIEIYLPLSSTLVLAFYCKSHEQEIREGMQRVTSHLVRFPDSPVDFALLLEWTRAFRVGNPLSFEPTNVLNHNSLQVRSAERFVYSSTDDFSLVEEMLADNPRFRTGPRLKVV